MMWKTKPFIEAMNKNGYAFFVGKVGFYPVSKLSTLIIKNEQDLILADYILRSKEKKNSKIEYDELAIHFLKQ